MLNGVSVFSLADAHRAGARMLAEGPVRAKLAEACGGLGQYVAHDLDELDAWLGGLEERQLAQGLVLEANLESIVTHSVGQLRVNGFLLSYHGHQHQTRNARGELVYAGSDLLVARGGYAELLALDLAREVRQAIEYARIFDTAAAIFFPGCFASRRNYDIAQGRDGNGQERFGVLEQSWRVGGASSAEIAALEAFRADPGLPAVRAASFEIHEDKRLPDNSRVIYYSRVDRYSDLSRDDTRERNMQRWTGASSRQAKRNGKGLAFSIANRRFRRNCRNAGEARKSSFQGDAPTDTRDPRRSSNHRLAAPGGGFRRPRSAPAQSRRSDGTRLPWPCPLSRRGRAPKRCQTRSWK